MSIDEDLKALQAALANGATIGPVQKGPAGFPLRVESLEAVLKQTTFRASQVGKWDPNAVKDLGAYNTVDEYNQIVETMKPWVPFPKEIIGRGYRAIEGHEVPPGWRRIESRVLSEVVLGWGEEVLMRWIVKFRQARKPVWYISPENHQRLETIYEMLEDDSPAKRTFWGA